GVSGPLVGPGQRSPVPHVDVPAEFLHVPARHQPAHRVVDDVHLVRYGFLEHLLDEVAELSRADLVGLAPVVLESVQLAGVVPLEPEVRLGGHPVRSAPGVTVHEHHWVLAGRVGGAQGTEDCERQTRQQHTEQSTHCASQDVEFWRRSNTWRRSAPGTSAKSPVSRAFRRNRASTRNSHRLSDLPDHHRSITLLSCSASWKKRRLRRKISTGAPKKPLFCSVRRKALAGEAVARW